MTTIPMYINGEFISSQAKKTRNVINPATNDVIAVVYEAQEEDVNNAVNAARDAFDNGVWKNSTNQERGKLLYALSQEIRNHFDELVTIEVNNNGKPKREATFDIDDAANCFEFYAGLATKIHGETMNVPANAVSYIVREPLGVCGQIIPWNYPFLMAAWKLAPALAAGNTVILKPSELTPLSVLRLAELVHKVGFPKGVVNIITGDGVIAGNALSAHSLIDKIAFTGGTVTGKKIMTNAAQNLKKVTLELGGKNSAIIFDDCNLDLTVDWTAFAAFANQGQVCSAASLLLVQESIYDKYIALLLEKIKQIKIGNGADDNNTMGAIISEAHLNKIMSYVDIAQKEGGKILCGGKRIGNKGFFFEPTIIGDVNKTMRIANEEVFGPVVAIIKFKTQEEAIQIANNSQYGLAAGVFSDNINKVHQTLKALKVGITWANWYHPTFNEMPWGGYKQSGIGRELGLYGIEAYLETKQININMDMQAVPWYS